MGIAASAYRLVGNVYAKRRDARDPPKKPSAVLAVSTTAIGDTLLSTPAIRALKATFPDARVDILADARRMQVLAGNPFVDSIIPYEKGMGPFIRTARRLREVAYDVAVVLHANDPDILPLLAAGRIPAVVGYREATAFPNLLTRVVPLREEEHAIEKRLDLVRAIGADTADRTMVLAVDNDELLAVRTWLDWDAPSGGGPKIAIHPGAARDYQRWPEERFAALAERLAKSLGAWICFTGSHAEIPLIDSIRRAVPVETVSTGGVFDIRRTAALLSEIDLFVTNDTGPMHMAFAVGTPTVALFMPFSDPKRIGPYHTRGPARVLWKEAPVRVANRKTWTGPWYRDLISVEEAFDAAESLLKAGGRSGTSP